MKVVQTQPLTTSLIPNLAASITGIAATDKKMHNPFPVMQNGTVKLSSAQRYLR
jgi:hypothetical protein